MIPDKYKNDIGLLKKTLELSQGILEHERSYDYTGYICVNVKLHGKNNYADLEDVLPSMKLNKKEETFIREEMTEERIDDLRLAWIEHEAHYFVDDYLDGCAHTPENQKDKEALNYMSLLDKNEIGFHGSNSGWLAVAESKHAKAIMEGINDFLAKWDVDHFHLILSGYMLDEIDIEDFEAELQDAVDEYVHIDYLKALQWTMDEAERMKDGLDFTEELKFRIEEKLDEYEEEEKPARAMLQPAFA